ncbi:lipase 3-like [Contarinia nasturtii]|uniref:lipase 3-like n=1 Tax=Contarinia nasturtii TaxID=265458 RepID=UPI0012D41370|nr:lipase 3-like [Contarinia nasturtii]
MFPNIFLEVFAVVVLVSVVISQNIFDPDAQFDAEAQKLCGFSTDEFIRYHGYESENHTVRTEDQYILTIFRANSKKCSNEKREPVLLVHGLTSTSDAFVTNPGNESLALFLADACYDVWLTNCRGTFYSKNHTTKNPDDVSSGFWNFTWYEIAIYDHPAVIDYILAQTNSSQLYYVGHSQGTTTLLVLLSKRPEYNDKINVASLMAPVGSFKYLDNSTKAAASAAFTLLSPFRNTELQLHSAVQVDLKRVLCAPSNIFGLCSHASEGQRNRSLELVYGCHNSGAALNQFLHYGECVKYQYFGMYIQEPGINPMIPDDFPLQNIKAKITLHYSAADPVADPQDVLELQSKLSNVCFSKEVDLKTFDHNDFAIAIHANELVYTDIVNAWKSYCTEN